LISDLTVNGLIWVIALGVLMGEVIMLLFTITVELLTGDDEDDDDEDLYV